MKGYNVSFGYMGFLPNYSQNGNNQSGAYVIFATEKEYMEIYNEIVKLHNESKIK